MKKLFKIASFSILGLGIIHTVCTPLFYETLDLNAIWFAGSGLATIYCALFNLSALEDYHGWKKKTCIISNFILLFWSILTGTVMPFVPQLIASFIFISGLTIGSVLYKPKPIF